MSDLATSIRDYYETAVEPISADEILARYEVELQPRGRRLRPAWVVAVASLVVLTAVGLAGLLGLLRQDRVLDDPVPTTVPVATTIPTTTIAPEVDGVDPDPPAPTELSVDELGWSPVPLDAEIFGTDSAWIADVAADSGSFVAVGREWSLDAFAPIAAVWLSPDGRDWVRVVDEEVMEAGQMVTVSASGGTVVAGGTVLVELSNGWVEDRHAIWWSGDSGSSWARATASDNSFRTGGIQAVVATTNGLSAAGYTCVGDLEGELLSAGALGNCDIQTRTVWKSVDGGEDWAMTWQSEPVDFGAGVWSLVDTDTGLMIAGWAPTPDGAGAATIWVESDNRAFEARVVDDLPRGAGNNSLVVMDVVLGSDGSLVAVGWEGDSVRLPGLWTSQDGVTWSRVAGTEDFPGVRLWGVTAAGPGYVAVGTRIGDNDLTRAVAFTSYDGLTWDHQEVAPLGNLEAVATDGQVVVSVGSEPDRGPAIWVGTP